jgi:acetyl-CoA decarbonylase/synthase complex subunit gamma
LDKTVSHKRIILPQLGAVGIAAHIIKEETGFNVHYGPVRASDIKKFISDGYRADKQMRKVTFNLMDRLKLIPNDIMYGKFYLLGAFALVFLISFISRGIVINMVESGLGAILNVFIAYSSGIIITPLLLPYLPGRQFSLKGFISGLIVAFLLFLFNRTGNNIYEILAWFTIIPVVSSFMAMNFTGSSTYTSLSGVKKEMKVAVPLQIFFSIVGVILLVISKLLN